MATLDVIDLKGDKVSQVQVSDAVFGADVKEHLLWEAVRAQRNAKRAGTAKVKTRAEVAYTKAKLYKQKGTGNARHGSKRANVFRGGGVVHGPQPRDYTMRVNKKVMAGALRSALSLRAKAGNLIVINEFAGGEKPKTKELAAVMAKLEIPRALLVDSKDNTWLVLSSRNLSEANFIDPRGLNVYDILNHPKLLVSEQSLRALEDRLMPSSTSAQASDSATQGA